MCSKRDSIGEKIARYRRLKQQIEDRQLNDAADRLLASLEAVRRRCIGEINGARLPCEPYFPRQSWRKDFCQNNTPPAAQPVSPPFGG
jgi:hypothetical protein